MKLVDLKKEKEFYDPELSQAVNRVLDSGWYLFGEETEKFEENFKNYIGARDVVAVGNCTDAITMLIKTIWKEGMPVILPNYGAYPTAVAVRAAGVRKYDIHYVDVDRSFCIDVSKLPEDLYDGIIIPVHMFGNSCNMEAINQYAEEHDHWVIEDCAQSTGNGTGLKGDFSVFSFYPTKPLGTIGDGGAIVSAAEDLDSMRIMRFYGQKGKEAVIANDGLNSRISEVNAAVLNVKLQDNKFEQLIERRREIANKYLSVVNNVRWQKDSVFHQFPLLIKEEAVLTVKKYFEGCKIQTAMPYPHHLTDMPPVSYKGMFRKNDSTRFRVSNKVITIPCHPFLTDKEVAYITTCILNIKEKGYFW